MVDVKSLRNKAEQIVHKEEGESMSGEIQMIMHGLADILEDKRSRDFDYKVFPSQETMEKIDELIREDTGIDQNDGVVELKAPNEVYIKKDPNSD